MLNSIDFHYLTSFDDLGLNWSVLITVEDNINDIEIVNEDAFFFSTENSKIYKTTNIGFTFESKRIEEFWHRNSSINGLEKMDYNSKPDLEKWSLIETNTDENLYFFVRFNDFLWLSQRVESS